MTDLTKIIEELKRPMSGYEQDNLRTRVKEWLGSAGTNAENYRAFWLCKTEIERERNQTAYALEHIND